MKIFKLLLILAITFFITSCSSNDNKEVLNFTSDNTLGLLRVNLKSITEKINAEKLLKERSDLDENIKFFLLLAANPKETGLDVDKPLYVIINPDKTNSEPEINFLISINDKEKFTESMSKILDISVKIDTKNFIYFDNRLMGSIKGDLAVLKIDDYNDYSYNNTTSEAVITEKSFEDFWNSKLTHSKTIKEQVNKSLTSANDMSGWMNVEAVSKYVSKGYIETLAINKLFNDAGVGAGFNFDKGKMEFTSTTFLNNDLKSIIKKYYNKNRVNYNLVDYINMDGSKSNLFGYFSLDLMNYIIKEAGLESTINNYMTFYDVTLEDITSTFTGDFAVVDFGKEANYSSKNAIVLGINKDKTNVLNKLYGKDKFLIGDNEILISDDSAILNNFKNKTKAKNSSLKKVSDVTFYFWSIDNSLNATNDLKGELDLTEATLETKEKDGNFTSKFTMMFDKKDENILYYIYSKNE